VNNIAAKPALLRTAYCFLLCVMQLRDAAFQNEALGCTLAASPDSKIKVLDGIALF
jgi:hypothetical protein